jgi:predicted nucleic acid-binding protein
MAVCYLDTSAVLKRYINEDTSAAFDQFVLARAFEFVLTPLALTEVISSLRRRVRMGDLSARYSAMASQQFQDDLSVGEWRMADFEPTTFRSAAKLISTLAVPLSTLDALHLASALHLRVDAFATADRQLATAARRSRLRVFSFF